MTSLNQSPSTGERSGFGPRRVALTAAAVIALSAFGLTIGEDNRFASAEPVPTIDTPAGRAPYSFADLVERVSPAVVSINVKGNGKTAQNEFSVPGLPDLPPDNPLYDF